MPVPAARFVLAFAVAVVAPAVDAQQRPGAQQSPDARVVAAPEQGLLGPTWILVEFQSMDDTTLKPGTGALYTLHFAEPGRLEVQADCARGRGTWKSEGPAHLEIGVVAMTKIACPPSALNERFVRDLAYVRSYVFRDGKLYISLLADGGIYAFEARPSH